MSLILKGGCHCGAVRFEALWGDRARLAQKCNCSICSKSGFIHAIVPDRDFKILSGHENLSSYKFNTNVADHVFCKICGIKSFYRPRSNPDGWSINLNCVENADALGFEVEPFDGINWESYAHTLAHLI